MKKTIRDDAADPYARGRDWLVHSQGSSDPGLLSLLIVGLSDKMR